MAKRKRGAGGAGGRRPRIATNQVSKSPYFMQPGKRGVFIVLHRACGNRVVPKVCGEMPSRTHAKMLINQLERAESVVKDLFLEATDDGIEALEAVLAACREEVLRRGPRVQEGGGGEGGGGGGEQAGESGGGNRPGGVSGRNRRGRPPRGRRGTPKFEPPPSVRPLDSDQARPNDTDPYNEAAG
ncbi:MAG TPA: hypothetical protein VGJ18_17570 [Gemmatimonadaceae bacterium]